MKVLAAAPVATRLRATPNGFRKLLADARASELRQDTAVRNLTGVFRVPKAKQVQGATAMSVHTRIAQASHTLVGVRRDAHGHAEALVTERDEAFAVHRRRLDSRQIDLICKDLLAGAANEQPELPTHAPPPLPVASPALAATPNPDIVRLATARARAALELARRIELFLGSSGPALELPLSDVLGASVHIERIGPGEVALTLRGDNGPPCAEAVSRIREAVKSRGLKIGALTVG